MKTIHQKLIDLNKQGRNDEARQIANNYLTLKQTPIKTPERFIKAEEKFNAFNMLNY